MDENFFSPVPTTAVDRDKVEEFLKLSRHLLMMLMIWKHTRYFQNCLLTFSWDIWMKTKINKSHVSIIFHNELRMTYHMMSLQFSMTKQKFILRISFRSSLSVTRVSKMCDFWQQSDDFHIWNESEINYKINNKRISVYDHLEDRSKNPPMQWRPTRTTEQSIILEYHEMHTQKQRPKRRKAGDSKHFIKKSFSRRLLLLFIFRVLPIVPTEITQKKEHEILLLSNFLCIICAIAITCAPNINFFSFIHFSHTLLTFFLLFCWFVSSFVLVFSSEIGKEKYSHGNDSELNTFVVTKQTKERAT